MVPSNASMNLSRTQTGEGTSVRHRGDTSEMHLTVKESLMDQDFSRGTSIADQDLMNRSQDLKGVVDGGVPPAVAFTRGNSAQRVNSTLDQIQETPELGTRKESTEEDLDLRSVPDSDAAVFEALQQIRRIIGSSNNLRKEFEGMDTNGDQLVSLEEFHFACAAMGTGLKTAQLTAVFNLIDLNKNGTLEFDEFIEAFDSTTGMTAMEFVAQQRVKEEEEAASMRSGETAGGGDAPPNSEETSLDAVARILESVKEV